MSDVFVDSPFCGTIIELHLENGGCVTTVDAYSEHFDYRFVSIDKLKLHHVENITAEKAA